MKRTLQVSLLRRWSRVAVAIFHALVGCYYLVASPPLQLIFEPLPSPSADFSVYIPGSGFSGFWFHLGLLSNHHRHQDTEYNASSTKFPTKSLPASPREYYCYSSGCLSLVLAATHQAPAEIYSAARSVQNDWQSGRIQRYEIVSNFLEMVLSDDRQEELRELLPKLRILVTSLDDGVIVVTPPTIRQLREALQQTTYIPWVTGPIWWDKRMKLDGGFSRMLHPPCTLTWSVPFTSLRLAVHTLNAGMSHEDARHFWGMGYAHHYDRQDSAHFDWDTSPPSSATHQKKQVNRRQLVSTNQTCAVEQHYSQRSLRRWILSKNASFRGSHAVDL